MTTKNEKLFSEDEFEGKCPKPTFGQIIFLLIILGLAIFITIDELTSKNIVHWYDALIDDLDDFPFWELFTIFCSLVIFLTLIVFPLSLYSISAGYIFSERYDILYGTFLSTVCVSIGALIGSSVAFFITRKILGEWSKQLFRMGPKWRAIDIALVEDGFKVNFLLRLSPLVPYNAMNYAMGVTQTTFRDFFLACVAMTPYVAVMAYLGAALSLTTSNGLSSNSPWSIGLYVFGAVILVISSVWLYYKTKEILERSIPDSQTLL